MNTEAPAMESETLEEYLERNWEPVAFRPVPTYCNDGDYVSFFFESEMCYAERVDSLLTVYLSEKTGDLVGCKIKGITELAKRVATFVHIDDGNVQVGLLFLSASALQESKQRYREIAEKAKDASVNLSEVLHTAV